jgi:hypothetical protein
MHESLVVDLNMVYLKMHPMREAHLFYLSDSCLKSQALVNIEVEEIIFSALETMSFIWSGSNHYEISKRHCDIVVGVFDCGV